MVVIVKNCYVEMSLTKLQIGTAIVLYFFKTIFVVHKIQSQETITMSPPSKEHLKSVSKMGGICA